MTGEITDTTDQFLAEKAEKIRALARRSVFEVGKLLAEVREKCPHGRWLPWLTNEFGWSHTHADNYMNIYRAMESGQIADKLQFGLGVSSLALLAAPSAPEAAREEVAERIERGEKRPARTSRASSTNTGAPPSPGPRAASSPRASRSPARRHRTRSGRRLSANRQCQRSLRLGSSPQARS